MSASPLTPLDYIAAGYWQDFLARRAVAGGIAYEVDLHHCGLDESLSSLQRIDTLLSQIRRDMVKTSIWDEATLLKDERYRNFMVFLAFYAGRVLAQQWQQSPRWFGQFELDARYPKLGLTTDDFYQHMAMFYGADTDVNTKDSSDKANTSLFFALEPIGMRLFGHIDRAFKSAQGGEVASGLYQAVSDRLPKSVNHQPHLVNTTIADKPNTQTANEKAFIEKVSPENSSTSFYSNSKSSIDMATNQLSYDKAGNVSSTAATTITSMPLAEDIEITNATAAPIVEPVKTTAVAKKPPTPEIFSQLLTELHEIEVTQTTGETEYEKACKVLDQFERHIAKQEKPRKQVVFSEAHLQAKQQALLGLEDAANAGNSAAMLRLAMYGLLGEGLIANEGADKVAGIEAGVEWVQQAASKNDSRAQRLLSKMYYQGVGVTQDLKVGKYWLEQAAENGHIEAASLVDQWQQAQTLINTQKQEQHSLKRYQLLFAVIIVIALLIIILV
ncbi:tetratricopeptide repeat protein [Psychrobacter cryohalolentis]|uniref:Sel1 n=1 Tax=Psychrobacter cryohalolentis (strain ATCC BAA-1226 / DSM 17306 / VKM B-2378 / K5) TaxID=335284 RepID=Q1Q9Z5_PSYCK|nr:tetratricopeptide repeat protein [Psychrobacter cryohalolentis]ABE75508.1 Sel1 [Psychrobacter cryohalolentis K5]ASE25698.1 sel1 repeat family protein [Psychrobacter cryohalolentis]